MTTDKAFRLPIDCAVLIVAFASSHKANAQHVQTFQFNGTNGKTPSGGLAADKSGNFYGVTRFGGSHNDGTVYQISPGPHGTVTQTVLYNFTNQLDGFAPVGDLQIDSAGNLYGVTHGEAGTVFELSPPSSPGGDWTDTQLWLFGGGPNDGAGPSGGVTFDSAVNLYGVTVGGGSTNCVGGCGVVYELSPPQSQGSLWTETILYEFQGKPDGSQPLGSVIFDSLGNLYGTTSMDGTANGGNIFQLMPPSQPGGSWTETVLYNFRGGAAGGPQAGLTLTPDGSMFGTTVAGGSKGLGTVFRISPPSQPGGQWQYSVVHSFGGMDGSGPVAALTLGPDNVLYGTTSGGGPTGGGVVFRTSTSGAYSRLYSFPTNQGESPESESRPTIFDGSLIGTTVRGGTKQFGTAFRLSP